MKSRLSVAAAALLALLLSSSQAQDRDPGKASSTLPPDTSHFTSPSHPSFSPSASGTFSLNKRNHTEMCL